MFPSELVLTFTFRWVLAKDVLLVTTQTYAFGEIIVMTI